MSPFDASLNKAKIADERHQLATTRMLAHLEAMSACMAPRMLLVGGEREGVGDAVYQTYGVQPRHVTAPEALKVIDAEVVDLVILNLRPSDDNLDLLQKVEQRTIPLVRVTDNGEWRETVLHAVRPLFAIDDTGEIPIVLTGGKPSAA